ncbi:MAG TPA: hypothetical protein VGG72_21320 [Bryobacteraceae bacterium]
MKRIKRRHERSIRVDPDEISHPALWDEARDLVGGVAVRVDKEAAVALPDVFDEEIHEQGGLAHAAHSFKVYVLCGIYEEFATGDAIGSD